MLHSQKSKRREARSYRPAAEGLEERCVLYGASSASLCIRPELLLADARPSHNNDRCEDVRPNRDDRGVAKPSFAVERPPVVAPPIRFVFVPPVQVQVSEPAPVVRPSVSVVREIASRADDDRPAAISAIRATRDVASTTVTAAIADATRVIGPVQIVTSTTSPTGQNTSYNSPGFENPLLTQARQFVGVRNLDELPVSTPSAQRPGVDVLVRDRSQLARTPIATSLPDATLRNQLDDQTCSQTFAQEPRSELGDLALSGLPISIEAIERALQDLLEPTERGSSLASRPFFWVGVVLAGTGALLAAEIWRRAQPEVELILPAISPDRRGPDEDYP